MALKVRMYCTKECIQFAPNLIQTENSSKYAKFIDVHVVVYNEFQVKMTVTSTLFEFYFSLFPKYDND